MSEKSKNNRIEKAKTAYFFLVRQASSGEKFTRDQLSFVTGWKQSTTQTYLSKKWKCYVQKEGHLLKVDRNFEKITLAKFLEEFSQVLKPSEPSNAIALNSIIIDTPVSEVLTTSTELF
ncbi:MAG: hypothetical protein K2X81_17920 [Candidatus Obscuribacterales bacterium]|nr:hypothetical protein [Candidatus Obscuribacterales bacterium]